MPEHGPATVSPDGTLPDQARTFLEQTLRRLQAVLGANFVGAYPYGSLATGEVDAASSDLDVLITVAGEVDDEAGSRLRRIFADLVGVGGLWTGRFEAAILPLPLLRRSPPPAPHAHVCMNTAIPSFWFGKDVLGPEWILNLHSVWTGNVSYAGPLPRTFIAPVSPQEIRDDVRNLLRNFWSTHLHGPEWMKPRKYQAFTILTMCRALYSAEFGTMISKPGAAAWATATLEPRWAPVIRRALEWRHDPTPDEEMAETLSFLRFVVGKDGAAASS